MSRVFRRGELKEAIVAILADLGEAHGYGIMGELKERVGGGWKPSPGAIYPALVALEDSGLVEAIEREETRVYVLTELGREAADRVSTKARWSSLTKRAEEGDDRMAVGSMLDRFASESPHRRRLAGSDLQGRINELLTRTTGEIEQLLEEGEGDG